MSRFSFPLFLPVTLLGLIACNSGAIDITATRGGKSLHFSDAGCAISLTGNTGSGPSAVDVTCPGNLRGQGATLHISTPLVTTPRAVPLRDQKFREPGHQLGQFLVITYRDGETEVVCDPTQARGDLIYSAVPKLGMPGRLAARFSEDAALTCNTGTGDLTVRGTFDLAAPTDQPPK
jgi:hypothetical protein